MSGHAANSPSSLARHLACLGSMHEEEGKPNPETKYSTEGTEAHELLSKILMGEFPVKHNYPVDMVAHCTDAAQFIWELIEADPELKLHVEVHVDPGQLFGGAKEVDGTADIILLSQKHIYVYDFKYGAGVDVAALHNKQCLAYGAGAICSLVPAGINVPEFYHFGIIQPRTAGPMVKQWDMGMLEFRSECEWVATQLKQIEPGAQLTTGSHCQFCRAKSSCPQRIKEATAVSLDLFNLATDGANIATLSEIPLTPTETNVTDISNQQMADLIDRAGLLTAIIADFKEELQTRILAGQPGCGYKVVRGTAHRKWIPDDAVLAKKFKNMKLREEDYYIKKLASPSVVEKCAKLTDKQQANLKKFWIKPEGKLTLKPTSATGDPVIHDSTAAFANAVPQETDTMKPFSFI